MSAISADLLQLGQTSIIVVCSGAKSILDLPATREILETLGVLVLGWGTSDFPSFYSRESGLPVDARIESAAEMADIWRGHLASGVASAILLTVPVSENAAMGANELEYLIGKALDSASKSAIRGKDLTPYLLSEIRDATGGKSVDTNVALLKGNAAVAAQVAREILDG
jgi:pseudouridine-5'-phosphate glycosidase